MKKSIVKLEDVLTLELQSLYDNEKSLKEKMDAVLSQTKSETLKAILEKYADSADHKRIKLDRMFSYVLNEPTSHASNIIDKLLDETLLRAKHTLSDKVKNLVLITGFQRINHYKIAAYKTALTYSLELELDTVADLIHQILEWEGKTDKALTELSFKEFSKSGDTIQP